MSRGAAPVVFVDANVLVSAALRDIVIYLALDDAIELHWSEEVLDEMGRALVRTRRATASGVTALIQAMKQALPEADTQPSALPVGVRLPDPNDEHILAAAVAGACQTIVTFNVVDFPASSLALCGSIRATDPDTFLEALLAVDEIAVVRAVRQARQKLVQRPFTPTEYLDNLRDKARLPRFAQALRAKVGQL